MIHNPKPIFDVLRKLLGRPLTQEDVGSMNDAIEAATNAEIVAPAPVGTMKPSQAAINLIHSFEQCKLDAYPDPGSKNGEPWTIGWGSTGEGICKGVRWTQAQADARFAEDLARFSQGVVRLLAGARTTQPQFDALVSFSYNVGLKALGDSTLLRKHKAGDYAGAADQFARWSFNDGKQMKGLVRRRAAEAALYRSGI